MLRVRQVTYSVVTSVPSPERPTYSLSVTGKTWRIVSDEQIAEKGQTSTLWKLDEMPNAWVPKRRSEAMATQSLPTMAMTEPPLYSNADWMGVRRWGRAIGRYLPWLLVVRSTRQ